MLALGVLVGFVIWLAACSPGGATSTALIAASHAALGAMTSASPSLVAATVAANNSAGASGGGGGNGIGIRPTLSGRSYAVVNERTARVMLRNALQHALGTSHVTLADEVTGWTTLRMNAEVTPYDVGVATRAETGSLLASLRNLSAPVRRRHLSNSIDGASNGVSNGACDASTDWGRVRARSVRARGLGRVVPGVTSEEGCAKCGRASLPPEARYDWWRGRWVLSSAIRGPPLDKSDIAVPPHALVVCV